MKKNRMRDKLGLIVLGIIAGFLVVEFIMSALSYFNTKRIPIYKHALRKNKTTRRILCFGDSFTYGIGADAGFSYPEQMEKILNDKEPGRHYEVFNLGFPGSNSTQVLKKLKRSCLLLKPDAVVVLCGGNDIWNFDECCLRLDRQLFSSLFARFKTAKLFYVFAQSIRSKMALIKSAPKDNNLARSRLSQTQNSAKLISYGNIFRRFGYYGWAKLFYQKARKNADNEALAVIELARAHKLSKQYLQAVDLLEYLLIMQPNDKQVHYELKDVFIAMDIVDEAILFYERFLLKFPDNYFAKKFLSQAYIHAAGDMYFNNYLKESRDYYLKALAMDIDNMTGLQDSLQIVDHSLKIKTDYAQSKRNRGGSFLEIADLYLADIVITERHVDEVLSENLNKIVDFCQNNHIKLFFSGYPELASPVMRKTALDRKVKLITHQERFITLLKDKPYLRFFVSEEDRHCTKHGYRILAENIAAAISEYFSDYTIQYKAGAN